MKSLVFFMLQSSFLFSIQGESSYPYLSGYTWAFFCNWRLLNEDYGSHAESFIPEKVQVGDTIFVDFTCLEEFTRDYLPRIPDKVILVTANYGYGADESMPGPYAFLLNDPKIAAWFVQNIDRDCSEKLIPISIGIASKHWPHGNTEILDRLIGGNEKSTLMYVNLTSRLERADCIEHFRKMGTQFAPGKSFEAYLSDLAQSKFVICPRGHGLDTHRIMETLLMGSYPVVQSSTLNPLFEDLPVVIVNDWSEVTSEFLEEKYREFNGKSWKREKLYAPYWFQKVRDLQLKLRNQVTTNSTYSLPDSHGVPLDRKLVEIMNYENGIFIEVGANDGILQSNTKLFEEVHGWTGILIEPSPTLFSHLCMNRPASQCFQCVLGSFEENGIFVSGDFDGHLMSSVNGQRLHRLSEQKVLVRSLQSILDELYLRHVNFFSLDTEGYELNVLKGIDFSKTSFDYLLIEIYTSQYDEIVSFLLSRGYEIIDCFSDYNHVANPYWDGTHNDYLFKRV